MISHDRSHMIILQYSKKALFLQANEFKEGYFLLLGILVYYTA